MIQITYLRERYSVLAPSWMAAFAKARDHLVIKGDLHPNDESYIEDITDLEYLLDVSFVGDQFFQLNEVIIDFKEEE